MKSAVIAIAAALVALFVLVAVVKIAFKLFALAIVVAVGAAVYLTARKMIGN